MQVESIQLFQFKNYLEKRLDFQTKVSCIVGENGIGKTNILDAIYALCLARSYYNSVEKHNINHGKEAYSISGCIYKNSKAYELQLKYVQGKKKKMSANAKVYGKLSEHWGQFPVIFITPNDLRMIDDFSEGRRNFMDSIICQYDSQYLKDLMQYAKILSHRNAALKKMAEERFLDNSLLDILDDQLVDVGVKIFEKRQQFEGEMRSILSQDYAQISENAEEASFSYESQLIDRDFKSALKESRQKDLIRQRTLVGVHKDDYLFSLDGHELKRFGSQGQKKSYLFALKLSLLKLLFLHSDVKPILLLDDVFDRLDAKRMRQLLELIFKEKIGHFFLTDTSRDRVEDLLKSLKLRFEVFHLKSANLHDYEVHEPIHN